MLIEIESLNGDILLSGKVSSVGQLKQRMMDVLDEVGSNDFVAIFCARYGYDIYPYDHNIKVDYIIDLDVHRVYKPAY
ncbi:hypothetical protein [Budvicia aquatica]|uniref:hypothetical protein n=1 Tax=Budvicia aquatica TaxID=82979 RepID=UPI00208407CF|nr:hypothetical protein [Budvicia aquatica]GKX53385.1 hypothetical protein SOASR029_36940 [Budvicia aquatica]